MAHAAHSHDPHDSHGAHPAAAPAPDERTAGWPLALLLAIALTVVSLWALLAPRAELPVPARAPAAAAPHADAPAHAAAPDAGVVEK